MDFGKLGPYHEQKPTVGDICTCIRCGDSRPFNGRKFEHTHDKPNRELCSDQRSDGELLALSKLTGRAIYFDTTQEEIREWAGNPKIYSEKSKQELFEEALSQAKTAAEISNEIQVVLRNVATGEFHSVSLSEFKYNGWHEQTAWSIEKLHFPEQ